MSKAENQTKGCAYSPYIYFLGLSYRSTAKAMNRFVERSHVSIWKWIQKYKPKRLSTRRKKVHGYIVDETQIKVGSQYIWLWVAIEPKHREILRIDVSVERAMLVAERFISSLMNSHGKHLVSTNGRTWYP